MVFGFFKKKKPQQPQPGAQQNSQSNASPPKTSGNSPQKNKHTSQSKHSTHAPRIPEEDVSYFHCKKRDIIIIALDV